VNQPDASLPGPRADWLSPDGLSLLAVEDVASGERFFPPLSEHSPLYAQYRAFTLGDVASVYSFTVIHPSPKTGQPSFNLIYADFPERVRVFGILEGAGRPAIGQRVRVRIREGEHGVPRYVFVAAE
jgi:hypothetical protein